MPYYYCSMCLGHPKLDYIHVRSHQHMNNIRKLPMKIGEEWWTMKTEDLFNYLNKNAIEKYNGNKHLANLPV